MSEITIMNEITIELLKRVIRTIEDDAQHEWLVDEINDYLNEIDLTEALPDKLVNESGCITISLEQVEAYIKTLSGRYDEWWSPEYNLYGSGLIDFLKGVDKSFGDEADAIFDLHAIEADKLEAKWQDKCNNYNMSVAESIAQLEAPKTEGQGYKY